MHSRTIPVLAFSSIIVFVLLFALVVTAEPSTQQQKDDEGGDDLPFWPTATATSTPRPTSTPTSTRCWRPGPQCPVSTNTPRPATATPAPTRCYGPGPQCTYPTNTPRPATSTPVPTATPRPATSTPVPTATPRPATATPLPTATPAPTSTPRPPATPRPTATPTIVVSIRPPSLRAAVDTRRVSLEWDLVTGATDYEIHYRKGNGGWTRRSVATQSNHGQAHISRQILTSDRDYEFQIRAASTGRNASATWGAWSGSYDLFTGPPPKPVLSALRIWDKSVIVSWPEIEGAAHSIAVASPVSTSRRREANIVGTFIDTHNIQGLRAETTYAITVKIRSDGTFYEYGWSAWSDPLSVTTLGPYAIAVDIKPRIPVECLFSVPMKRESSTETRHFSDGTSHKALSGIWVRTIFEYSNQHYPTISGYCVSGGIQNVSKPGTEESSWSGKMYEGELAIISVNVTRFAEAIRARSLSPLVEFFQQVLPDRSGPADYTAQHSCSNRCKGGIVYTETTYVTPRLLKHQTFHLYGSHDFESGDDSWEPSTTTMFQVDTRIYNSLFGLLGGVLVELAGDILDDVADAIEQAVTGGNDDD